MEEAGEGVCEEGTLALVKVCEVLKKILLIVPWLSVLANLPGVIVLFFFKSELRTKAMHFTLASFVGRAHRLLHYNWVLINTDDSKILKKI